MKPRHSTGIARALGTLAALTVLAPLPVPITIAAAGAPAAPVRGDRAELIGTFGPEVIAEHYIVVLRDVAGADAVTSVSELAVVAGGTVGFTYHAALRRFSASLPPSALAAVRADDRVAYVEADRLASVPADDSSAEVDEADPIWNLDRIDQRTLPLDGTYAPPGRGAGVTAYVLDTGIWFTHPEFEDRATSGYDFVDDDPNAKDCNGHGTHVAGTIVGKKYGVANAAHAVALRVVGCDGTGPWSTVIAGVDWVTANAEHPAVANVSLGGRPSRAVDQAIKASINTGVTYAVAAGNESQDACKRSPARAPLALTVGATDKTDRQWSRSNFGSCLDLYAPGVLIRSAWPADTGITNTISGTSMASPDVAGTAAVYLGQHSDATAKAVRRAVVNGSTEGELTQLGPDSPNTLVYVDLG